MKHLHDFPPHIRVMVAIFAACSFLLLWLSYHSHVALRAQVLQIIPYSVDGMAISEAKVIKVDSVNSEDVPGSNSKHGGSWSSGGSLENQPPTCDAGPDLIATLENDSVDVEVNGSVTDDGLPNDVLHMGWGQEPGPAPVIVNPEDKAQTTMSFTEPGEYTLYVKASDGPLGCHDFLKITIEEPVSNGHELKAFPGAVGFGAFTKGGRGGAVCTVKTLEDYRNNETPIPDSLRYCIREVDGPRTIVFAIGGNIELKQELVLRDDYVTIAGQTAPGDGITLYGYPFRIYQADNVIVRYLRSRTGDFNAKGVGSWPPKGNGDLNGDQARPFTAGTSRNVIFDHLSASWGIDENITMWKLTRNGTIQNSLIAEPLNQYHPKLTRHGFNVMINGDICDEDFAAGFGGVTLANSVLITGERRNPTLNGGAARGYATIGEVVNNVIVGWRQSPAHTEGNYQSPQNLKVNFMGNYSVATRNLLSGKNPAIAYSDWSGLDTKFYHGDTNMIDSNLNDILDGDTATDVHFKDFEDEFLAEPFNFPMHVAGQIKDAQEAYDFALVDAGYSLKRDFHDERFISEVHDQSGRSILSQDDLLDEYPELDHPIPPADSGEPIVDTDGDGMPDDWEIEKGLNPDDSTDGNATNLSNLGCTNLEMYINLLVSDEGCEADVNPDPGPQCGGGESYEPGNSNPGSNEPESSQPNGSSNKNNDSSGSSGGSGGDSRTGRQSSGPTHSAAPSGNGLPTGIQSLSQIKEDPINFGDDPANQAFNTEVDPTGGVYFVDLIGHWAEPYVNELRAFEHPTLDVTLVEGYGPGQERLFKPNEYITRSHFLKLLVLSQEYDIQFAETHAFRDTGLPADAPAEQELLADIIYTAKENRIVFGNPDGTFSPNRPVTRGEAAVLFKRALPPLKSSAEQSISFPDVAVGEWYYFGAVQAKQRGLFEGYKQPDGTRLFKPNQPITRAEAVAIIVRGMSGQQ